MSNRRESVGRLSAQQQSASGPPSREFVSVAVLPPRLPPGVAPPTGIAMSDAMSWDETVNWKHNEMIDQDGGQVSTTKRLMRKSGLTTQRKKRNEDLPPFVFRQIPYDIWRKHYAKDKEGRYRGTHAPAEDCLLMPEDVMKWRLDDPKTKADLWTRGKDALPVYAESQESGAAPAYSESYDGPPPEEPRLTSVSSSEGFAEPAPSGYTADGRTSEQIIKEAEAKAKVPRSRKESWKASLRSGVNFTMG